MDIGGIIVSTTALGVRQSDDTVPVGTTANALRHILAAQWSSTGVIDGLKVTGTSSLAYHVAAGTAVCSKGSSDGKTLAYFEGANTPGINSNSSGNPRIDSVYIYANDLDQGDSDNLVHVGVVQGTPATNPAAPGIPTYGTLLAQMLMPAGSASASNASNVSSIAYAIPYGASLGLIGWDANSTTTNQNWDNTWYSQASKSIYLSTDRYIKVVFDFRAVTLDGSISSMYFKLQIDGTDYTDGSDERPIFNVWARDYITWTFGVNKGNHTFNVLAKANTSKTQIKWEGTRTLKLFDTGVKE